MKIRVIMACIFIPLGIIIAVVPENTESKYKLTAQELLQEIITNQQFISCNYIADKLITGDSSIQIIDLRTQEEFQKYSIPKALNIPISEILETKWINYLNQDKKTNILYTNGSLKANQAWMILRQLGYQNNYVLLGGLNYWAETILNPQNSQSFVEDEENLIYDIKNGTSFNLVDKNKSTESVTKKIIKRIKRKRANGEC